MKILLNQNPADGNGDTKPTATPPIAAEVAANGKTEREILLEKQNARLLKVARETLDSKKATEEKAAVVLRENELLKQSQQKTAEHQKSEWLWFK